MRLLKQASSAEFKELAVPRVKDKQFQLTSEDCGFKQEKSSAKQKQVVPAKFRGPNGETWSGRGRVPGWLAVIESQGGSREKFRID